MRDDPLVVPSQRGRSREVARLGESAGKRRTNRFVRMVTPPGVGHNGDGPEADSIDLVEAIDDWADDREAPDSPLKRRRPDQG